LVENFSLISQKYMEKQSENQEIQKQADVFRVMKQALSQRNAYSVNV